MARAVRPAAPDSDVVKGLRGRQVAQEGQRRFHQGPKASGCLHAQAGYMTASVPAIPGQHLSALISMRYIFSFREGKSIFFNGLDQNCSV